MKMQQFDSRIISITDIRRNITILEKVLEEKNEAWVMRNQSLLFIAINPQKYQELMAQENGERIDKTIKAIELIRSKVEDQGEKQVSSYVVKTRNQRVAKWKK